MSVNISCSHCKKQLHISEEFIGDNIICPNCGEEFTAKAESISRPSVTLVLPGSGSTPPPPPKKKKTQNCTEKNIPLKNKVPKMEHGGSDIGRTGMYERRIPERKREFNFKYIVIGVVVVGCLLFLWKYAQNTFLESRRNMVRIYRVLSDSEQGIPESSFKQVQNYNAVLAELPMNKGVAKAVNRYLFLSILSESNMLPNADIAANISGDDYKDLTDKAFISCPNCKDGLDVCKYCKGTGVCTKCNGAGFIRIVRVQGDENVKCPAECQYCSKGPEKCSMCHGIKYLPRKEYIKKELSGSRSDLLNTIKKQIDYYKSFTAYADFYRWKVVSLFGGDFSQDVKTEDVDIASVKNTDEDNMEDDLSSSDI